VHYRTRSGSDCTQERTALGFVQSLPLLIL
jgi:hypothetical protein